ncbi:MAG: 3-deoxy-7-phosphoheptulonate synthase [Moorea sp. SIO2B7]|nr:3-deoxy-7-phosphoheptulonate synthase [Moorena sp. SIO2B7]
MDKKKISDTRIDFSKVLLTPQDIKDKLPLSDEAKRTVLQGRQEIENIIDGKDSRKFIVVGPCSIHDVNLAKEYAQKLKKIADKVKDKLLLVMRVYFEKPRTTVGWKGFINDPDMDDSFKINKGLLLARKLLLEIAELGLITGTEALDPITPQYISELVSWAAIGARTIESQTHREMASGLSMPVGFKNGTDGNIKVAFEAMQASRTPHSFLGINILGQVSILNTKGNPYGHIILRGGGGKPNFEPKTIQWVEENLNKLNLPPKIVIDCSHGNSNKDHTKQAFVLETVIQQILDGDTAIIGMMLESNLNEGNQKIPSDISKLKYGVSVTDKCIGWEETEKIILAAYEKLSISGQSE